MYTLAYTHTRLPLWPWEDASILAKLYPCLGQGIHNSRDHNIPYMYELTGAPASALSRPPSRHVGDAVAGLAALTAAAK